MPSELVKYLEIYTAPNPPVDWKTHLDNLTERVRDRDRRRQQVAFAILLPAYDKSVVRNGMDPAKLLFGAPKFDQFDGRDWWDDLIKVKQQDDGHIETRQQALNHGFVYPLEYNPRWRQAFRWLIERVEKHNDNDLNLEDSKHKFENLVFCYGGAIICNIFNKPELSKRIESLPNWRTAYFFERLIHKVYKPEEIIQIKKNDIEEIKRSDPKLIKYLAEK